jgi:WD40 repeat protein
MRYAGFGSLQQLEAAARRRRLAMPVSTADRALNTDRLPTADFVRRFVTACGVAAEDWLAVRDSIADRRHVRSQEPQARRGARAEPGPDAADFCPYPGLAPFTFDQSQWFFGRERALAELIQLLTERLEGTGPLLVVAPSGAGKSSLLRAGLVPALRRGVLPGSSRWPCAVFTPTADPIGELERQRAALPLAERTVLIVDQFEETFTLCAEEASRRAFVHELAAAARDTRAASPATLVVLGLRADFYGHCATHPELVESLRYGQLLLGAMTRSELRDAIEKPATAAGLRLAPGLVDVMLSDLGVGDSQGRTDYAPGALPLLSHVLFATWQQRTGHTLTLEGYRLAGGIQGGIAATAERAYRQLDEAGQRVARQQLLQLVQVGDSIIATRRRLDRSRILAEAAEPALAETVMDTLARTRLVTLDQGTVEIAHEALLRAWPRLREWLDHDRAWLLVLQRLAEAADTWESEGRHPSALYRGPRLAAARDWAEDVDYELSPLVREFLDASLDRERTEQRLARRRTRRLRQLVAGLSALSLLAATTTAIAVRAQAAAQRQRDQAVSRTVAGQATALRADNPALADQLSLAAYQLAPTAEARGSLLSAAAAPYATVLTGHSGYVHKLAFGPGGRILASASADHTVRLWNTEDPRRARLLAVVSGHSSYVFGVAFSPDGRILATAGADGTVRLWNITDPSNPTHLATVPAHADWINDLSFSPDGRLLASASNDRTFRLWDITTPASPRLAATVAAHAGGCLSVAFSPAGNTLATAGADHRVRLWDLREPSHPTGVVAASSSSTIGDVNFSPDGAMLVAGSDDGAARLWRSADGAPLGILSGHTGPVTSATFGRDGHTVATTSVDNTARLWDVSDVRHPAALAVLTSHTGRPIDTGTVASGLISPDGRTLATGSYDYTVRLWALPGPAVAGQPGAVRLVRLDAADHSLVTVTGTEAAVRHWTVRDHGELTNPVDITIPTQDRAIQAVAFAGARHLLLIAVRQATELWNIADPHRPARLAALRRTPATDETELLVLSRDGKTLIAIDFQHHDARIWNITDPHQPTLLTAFTLTSHRNSLNSATLSADGGTLVSSSNDHTARLWDLTDPRHPAALSVLPGHTDAVNTAAFSPDDRMLTTVSNDHTARLWDLTDLHHPVLLAILTGHVSAVTDAAFAPDGRTLAIADADDKIQLWNLADPRQPELSAILTGHTDTVNSLAYASDGDFLVSGSSDGTIRIWDTSTDQTAARICERADRPITPDEWKRYFPGLSYHAPCR